MSRTLGLAALALLAALPALAQGTPEQREACTPDVMRLCSAEIPDVPRIVACLKRERPKVSPACQNAMGPALGQDVPTAVASTQVPANSRRAVR